MKKRVKKTLNRAIKWWKKTTWFKKTISLFGLLCKLYRFVCWLQGTIPTIWPIIEEALKNLL